MNLFKQPARRAVITILMVCLLGMTGCDMSGHDFVPTKNSLFIGSDYTVMSAEFADFDNSKFDESRYDTAEFQTYAEETVTEYNTEKADLSFFNSETAETELPVSIESLSVTGTQVELILKFKDFSTYADFYGNTDSVPVKNLVVGTVADGTSSGLAFEDMVDADGAAADPADIKSGSGYNLVMLTGNTEIQCEGKILYFSKSMTLKDDYTVESTGDVTEFIIFK